MQISSTRGVVTSTYISGQTHNEMKTLLFVFTHRPSSTGPRRRGTRTGLWWPRRKRPLALTTCPTWATSWGCTGSKTSATQTRPCLFTSTLPHSTLARYIWENTLLGTVQKWRHQGSKQTPRWIHKITRKIFRGKLDSFSHLGANLGF